jgi:threonine synthase
MLYLSTRGDPGRKHFCEILLEGLAPDGGLYLPQHYPQVDDATLTRWRSLKYADLAFEILSLYIDDIPAADLKAICHKTYTEEVFGTPQIVPLRRLDDGLLLEGLSNGPTLAFKDMAMQLLGNLFEYELARRGEELNILGATSGDTGSAAEYAMRGKKGVRVFMTSPHGRMSPFQQAQMFSLQDANIHNLAIQGVFDDCQDIVKAVSTTWRSSASTRSARSTRSTGRGWWPRWCTTLRVTCRPPRRTARRSASPCRAAISAMSAQAMWPA